MHAQVPTGGKLLWASSCAATGVFLLLPIDLDRLPASLVYVAAHRFVAVAAIAHFGACRYVGGVLVLGAIVLFVRWSGARWNRYWTAYVSANATALPSHMY